MTGRSRAVTKQRQHGLVNIHKLSPSPQYCRLCWSSGGLLEARRADTKHTVERLEPLSSSAVSLSEVLDSEARLCVICSGWGPSGRLRLLKWKQRSAKNKHHIAGVFFPQRLKTLIEVIGLPDKYKIRFSDLVLDELLHYGKREEKFKLTCQSQNVCSLPKGGKIVFFPSV